MDHQIICPECGHYCSDQAYSCPRCGHPFRNPDGSKVVEEYTFRTMYIKVPKMNYKSNLEMQLNQFRKQGWEILNAEPYPAVMYDVFGSGTYKVFMRKKNAIQQKAKICSQCGNKCDIEAVFCPKCGERLSDNPSITDSNEDETKYESKTFEYRIRDNNCAAIADYLIELQQDGWEILDVISKTDFGPVLANYTIFSVNAKKKII